MEVNDKKRIGNSRDDPDVAFSPAPKTIYPKDGPGKGFGECE